MSSTICGLCNLDYHVKNFGWVWREGVGLHSWEEPTKEQIRERLRKKYGLS